VAVAVAALLGSLLAVVTGSTAYGAPTTADAAAVPKLSITGQEAAFWIAEKVAGGLVAAVAGKGFNEVLAQITGDKTSAQLDAIKSELDSIKNQLDQLQNTMNLVLQEVVETHFDVLAERVKTLRDDVNAAEGDFLEDLSLAGKPDSKARRDILTKRIIDDVTGKGGLISQVNTIPEAILPSALTSKPFYHVVSNVTTVDNTKKFFTWRDSARIDAVYQYLIDLQALQFNLIVQVETLQGASVDTMYTRYVQPYLGDKASFQAFLDKKVPAPTVGSLHDELGAELKPLPPGVVVEMSNRMEWSVDVPGGAQQFFLNASGPGVPVCSTQAFPPGPSCITDPHDTLGPNQPNWPRNPSSAAGQLAAHMASLGYGTADQWQVPLMSDLTSLQSGWSSSDGTLNDWLQSQMGANPKTCKPVIAGSGEAISDWNACVWPKYPYTWSSDYWGTTQTIRYENDTLRTYIYGWGFNMYNTDDASQVKCFNFTNKLDWSDLVSKYGAGELVPTGETMDLPKTTGCGGPLELVRVLRPGDDYFFPA
jgi:uncharacterized membrane-anchored protein YhcB (DUF1043 family)